MSYLEIYNEDVRDLLGKDQNAKLEVCEVKEFIVALAVLYCTSWVLKCQWKR